MGKGLYKARTWLVRKLGGEMPLPGAVGNRADVVVSTRSLEKVCACMAVSRATMIRDAEFCEKYAKERMGRGILAQMMELGIVRWIRSLCRTATGCTP